MKDEQNNGMIHVWLKGPGETPEKKWIPNQLEFLQMFVAGYIETFTLSHDLVVICNEEGKIMGLPYNCTICTEDFMGNIIIAGTKGEEFTDVPLSEELLKDMLPGFWEK